MAERKLALAANAVPMLRQVMTSVAATIIATGALTVVQHQFATWHAPAATPSLTSGGKFAARLQSAPTGSDVASAFTPPALPLLLSLPAPILIASENAPPAIAAPFVTQPVTAEPAKPVRRAGRIEKTRPVMVAVADAVVPPRRSESLTASAPAAAVAEDDTLWHTTKVVADQALDVGSAIWSRITPSQFVR